MSWSPNGNRIASASHGSVHIWNANTAKLEELLKGHTGSVNCVSWSPDGKWLAGGSHDNSIRIWDASSGRLEQTLKGHTHWVQSVSWSPDGQRLVSGAYDKNVCVWNVARGNLDRTLVGHQFPVLAVSWSSDGQRLASGSSDCSVRIWQADSGALERTLVGHQRIVLSVSWSPDCQQLASGSVDNTVRIWDAASGQLVQLLAQHSFAVGCADWSPDGKQLATGSTDRCVRIWDAASGMVERTLVGHALRILCVAWSHDGKRLASGSYDNSVCIWDAETGKLEHTLLGHTKLAHWVSWSPDGKRLTSGSWDEIIRIWRLDDGKLERTLEGDTAPVKSVTWSPDGVRFASGSGTSVRIWEVGNGRLDRTLTGHTAPVQCVTWSPDGKRLASGSQDNTVRIWNVESGKLDSTLEGHQNFIDSVRWSPDGKMLVSASWDKSVRIWDIQGGDCVGIQLGVKLSHRLLDVAFRASGPCAARYEKTRFGEETLLAVFVDELAAKGRREAVRHLISAKVVLVGESNVGKSYLAHRIVNGMPPDAGEIQSTHGMKIWSLEPERLCANGKTPKGQRRDVVLWDMGGQEEYRLVHQLFLHDTTVALVLLDPTRGISAFKEAETWNKYLEKQLRGREAVKLLVGAKLDKPSDVIDRPAIERLCRTCGFTGYYETSAITGHGLEELCLALEKAIDWNELSKTTRPELFQQIRDEIEAQRKRGEVVLHTADLHRALSDDAPTEEVRKSVEVVTEQLAAQGVVACSRVGNGEAVIVLQIHEIERYAGSLIVAARNNPRVVPALELRAIGMPGFALPGIATHERLPRRQERAVLDCTIRLLVEHGVCFEHEGLLVFPTLFAAVSAVEGASVALPHAVSLHYDFAGAIDNIYASLVAWLVVVKDFGRIRLWPDRAEFEATGGGLCGLRKVGRPGGFAHVDVYFDANASQDRRDQFVSFVEDHLAKHGVEILERLAIQCPCGEVLPEETLRKRIARGDKDISCPVCDSRHSLAEGATSARKRDPKIAQHTWALKCLIAQATKDAAKLAVQRVEASTAKPVETRPIRLLHLSDLHFDGNTPVRARLQWLLDDVKHDGGLGFRELDYLVVSGDFTDQACPEGFERAYEFLSQLAEAFALSAERCILVPGNHDVAEPSDAYVRRKDTKGLRDGEWVQEGRIILVRDPEKYPLRFKLFSDGFYHKFLQRPYPMASADQGVSIPFWDSGIQFLTLNSCWEIDEFDRKRAGIHRDAVANAVAQAQKQIDVARQSGQLAADKPILRIAVWHHAVTAPAFKMQDLDFLGHLQKNDVKLALHGDVHEMRRDQVGYWHPQRMHIVGGGSFGARATDRGESIPRLYNVLEINRDFSAVRVHTRRQLNPDSVWSGWCEWPAPNGGEGQVAYYDIKLNRPG